MVDLKNWSSKMSEICYKDNSGNVFKYKKIFYRRQLFKTS